MHTTRLVQTRLRQASNTLVRSLILRQQCRLWNPPSRENENHELRTPGLVWLGAKPSDSRRGSSVERDRVARNSILPPRNIEPSPLLPAWSGTLSQRAARRPHPRGRRAVRQDAGEVATQERTIESVRSKFYNFPRPTFSVRRCRWRNAYFAERKRRFTSTRDRSVSPVTRRSVNRKTSRHGNRQP
jgi:hypothetical protein